MTKTFPDCIIFSKIMVFTCYSMLGVGTVESAGSFTIYFKVEARINEK